MVPDTEPPVTVRAQVSPQELEDLGVLRGVAWAPIWGLIAKCNVITLGAGEVLIEAGKVNTSLYVVLSGRLTVRISKTDEASVAELGRGETVGEISIIDQRPTSAWVVATEPSRLLRIEERVFWDIITSSHQFAVNLLLLLSSRLRGSIVTLDQSHKLRARWEQVATFDVLTGLRNRRWFEETWPRLVRRFQFSGASLSLLILDIDHFKGFNDRFGHATGDVVLAGVAKTLVGSIRPTDMVVRLGGEEIAVVLPGTPLEGAQVVAERIRHAVADAEVRSPDGALLPQVTISIGATELVATDTPAKAVARADAALYRAKASGRNRVIAEQPRPPDSPQAEKP